MKIRRSPRAGLIVIAMLLVLSIMTLMAGCRAFEPEAVIVNQLPETYIVGSPMEHQGGYYHFHVYWYGSDRDGNVEKFVWALTDTTLQDEDTIEDEENENFNPALDSSQLAIANWTTKTDSIFDFTIDQGVSTAYDMTLHLVAIDDFGDYDRTPARLHFFSNTLGNPVIQFFGTSENGTVPLSLSQSDTVGFNKPYTIFWEGLSPNIAGYDPVALAVVDTVEPRTDGLFGYKWKLEGELGGNCLPILNDCWSPRYFDEASGDSVSFFGDVTSLTFLNNGTGISPFRKLLPTGEVTLEVNSIDVAGVEVAEYLREISFVVNFDPITEILDYEVDEFHTADQDTYPYYILLNDSEQIHHPFRSGDRIPDRSYVVVKALGRDSANDVKFSPTYEMGFTGSVTINVDTYRGGPYDVTTPPTFPDTEPQWDAGLSGWYADTLGFLVAPSSEMTVNVQAVDEHGRPDGTPASLSFDVGYPPCVQCVELQPEGNVSAYDETLACYDPAVGGSHVCFDGVEEFYIKSLGAPEFPDRRYLIPSSDIAFLSIDKTTMSTSFVVDTLGISGSNYLIKMAVVYLDARFHGKDHEPEQYTAPGQETWRTMGWMWQVDYDCDPENQIRDGGGSDNIGVENWGVGGSDLTVEPNGVWKNKIRVYVPTDLLTGNETSAIWDLLRRYWNFDVTFFAEAKELFDIATRQIGLGQIQAITIDQTQCLTLPQFRPASYHIFDGLRPLASSPPVGKTWRSCDLNGSEDAVPLRLMTMTSSEGEPVTKSFRLIVQAGDATDFECTGDGF
jgi:hypothetical protein